ncbi:MAG: tRNA glutamyl-Q(34) synthetase GluQRS [Chromatiales bacterium]|nr:tRNA glutamyl-Q(34) synthetase GluQRS [Chromatiales bacterium]MDP6150262.1 tRNA glutamyl-Q(34) synthetase GluQRS [Gammaproteobacteria bacterium]MDP7093212.1 tRNA glutamyl-Q(34) synthetase GluQRS [Gammaproteobacteria bacterium]HJP04342.1 tRNA glutamyl-Q(34) synthetase GluQRS [Gammaproteobacteria bacterium]
MSPGNSRTQETVAYRGRFAPSPTGPLHFGSLVAAVASYLQAKINDGEWLVRVEDIDPPREVPGATSAILASLDSHGFEYSTPLYQSTRLEFYDDLIEGLLDGGLAYRCVCTRRQIEAAARRGVSGFIYPGTCRPKMADTSQQGTSVRVYTSPDRTCFTDELQGRQCCELETEVGDFLVRRGDGLVAYQLAVVADDYAQGISEVVRGTDLLDATFMQTHLQHLLGYDSPKYLHFPVVTDENGTKLSKQSGAAEINDNSISANLYWALHSLRQHPQESLKTAPTRDIWNWAVENWDLNALRGLQTLPDGSMMMQ